MCIQLPGLCIKSSPTKYSKDFRKVRRATGSVSAKNQTPAVAESGQLNSHDILQDEDKPEDEMAQKRASLLERQQRRVEEARRRKQWQEAEKEQKREEAAR